VTLDFEPKRVRLPIRFGPKTLFKFSFSGAVCSTHLTDMAEPVSLPAQQADVVVFGSMPVSFGPKKTLSIQHGRLYYSPKRFPRYLVDLESDYETYLNSFSSKTRSTMKRKVRKFQEAAGEREIFKEYKNPNELLDFYLTAGELSKRTYQEKVIGTGLPKGEEFKQEMLRLGAEDNVRAYTLHLDGKTVAYLYSPAKRGILYYDFLGYDPDFAHLSPGSVLQWLAIQSIFNERKFRIYDFEEGEGQHKQLFATSRTECANLLVFTPTPKSILFILLDVLLLKSTEAVLAVIRKLNARALVRRLYR